MKTPSKTLVAGTHQLLSNNGSVRFINTGTDTQTLFPKGWAADGIRSRLRLPKVGETVVVQRDLVIEKKWAAV